KEAAILTCDGAGEWQTTILGKGVSEQLEVAECIDFPHSLGLLYSAFTAFLGFEVNEGEYKVMGMAGFGKPRFIDLVYKTIDVSEDGSFKLNMEYFSFHESESNSFNRRFRGLFGVPRKPDSGFDPSSEQDLRYADIAASIQKVTEDILLKAAIYLKKKSGMRNLCMAGGVALNCVANSRIFKESGFDDIYIQPASGDSGAALGAALYAYHCLLKKKKAFVMENAYWGPEFNDTEIKNILDRNGSNYLLLEEEPLLDQVACLLDSQKVVGWFEGRAEWGPRALGNRSILADPRNLEMKQTLNKKIKFREEFRPFSPCILEEKAQEYFDIDVNRGRFASKFMLLTGGAKKKDAIPAAVNIDGTGRVQPVNKVDNPLFYRLLEKFYQRTGMPALINTSFNLKGEPIVNTPEDALNTFFKSGMDALVLGHFLIKKEK
ncbi:MAG TPA: carbamoyltransferase C-terminal domain-containing protein, partial [Candidatus Omnitrophota bacterium]|nr:carbamoyltransferase C-terminal domain-containing protein [Candidatus Omnitrophota bacterium]